MKPMIPRISGKGNHESTRRWVPVATGPKCDWIIEHTPPGRSFAPRASLHGPFEVPGLTGTLDIVSGGLLRQVRFLAWAYLACYHEAHFERLRQTNGG